MRKPIKTALVMVVAVDFFLIPKNKGMRETPPIMNAMRSMPGISPFRNLIIW